MPDKAIIQKWRRHTRNINRKIFFASKFIRTDFFRTIHMFFVEYLSPCGKLIVAEERGALVMCDWLDSPKFRRHFQTIERLTGSHAVNQSSETLGRTVNLLNEYFDGKPVTFDMEVMLYGSDFAKKVLNELREITFGQTLSYKSLAERIRAPKAVRAVANAVANNVLSIVIPCHRIIGNDGSLKGYAGGEDAKRYLLAMESAPSTIDIKEV